MVNVPFNHSPKGVLHSTNVGMRQPLLDAGGYQYPFASFTLLNIIYPDQARVCVPMHLWAQLGSLRQIQSHWLQRSAVVDVSLMDLCRAWPWIPSSLSNLMVVAATKPLQPISTGQTNASHSCIRCHLRLFAHISQKNVFSVSCYLPVPSALPGWTALPGLYLMF